MKNNISKELKEVLYEFKELRDENKLYIISIILNHLDNGLINDGNYTDSDEAYENNKNVLTDRDVGLDDPMKLATNLLVVGANMEETTINPNGIDIEPYVNEKSKLEIKSVMSKFYKLDFKNKIDFLIETFYEISEIKDVEKISFDFNGLIDNLLTYSRIEFGGSNEINLEV